MRRSEFLATTACVATAGAVSSRPARAAGDPYDAKPEHVSLEYDEATLEKYRPRLITRHLQIEPSYLYGWVASSNEFELDVACYWCWYEGQVSDVKPASHKGDREPIYIGFDPDTGEVKQVAVDGYHYFSAYYEGEEVPIQDNDEFRTTWHVQKPYHFYSPGGEAGTDVDLGKMTEQYPDWWKNGWHVHQRSVVVPWMMLGDDRRSDWWPDDVGTFSYEAALRDIWFLIGIRGADDADEDALKI